MLEIVNWTLPGGEWEEMLTRATRHPMLSYDKSDSEWDNANGCGAEFRIGDDDRHLMCKLSKISPSERKFMRQWPILVELKAPIYWWKEMDQYRIGVTSNSTSTMHKIAAREFTRADFACEYLAGEPTDDYWLSPIATLDSTIKRLNELRDKYLETKDKKVWYAMIQLLPSSYYQTRTVSMSLENLRNIYEQRRHHKLDEWHTVCNWIETLPVADIILARGVEI